MAEAFRRLLWFVPVVAAFAALLFYLVANLDSVQPLLSQPLFYNPQPLSAEVAAKKALNDLHEGKAGANERLVTLGGAALPTILRKLPSMPVAERRRVADALWPVAERMNLGGEALFLSTFAPIGQESKETSSDQRLLFWERFSEEHATDLRPLSIQRLVKRAAERGGQLRGEDLRAVDTYALPTLVAALGRVSSQDDVVRCSRLVEKIAHATSQPWRIATDESVAQAKITVTAIRRYWDLHGPQWTPASQFQLLVASIAQTEFAIWVTRSIRELYGLDHSNVAQELARASRFSLPLLLLSLVGLLFCGPLFAATIQVVQLGDRNWRIERVGLRLALAGALMFLFPLIASKGKLSFRMLGLLSLLVGAAFSAFLLHRELNDRLDWRTHHVLRARGPAERITAVARWVAPSIPTLLPMALAEAAVWVTCLEAKAMSPGLGAATLTAVRSGDLPLLMAVCIILGVLTGALQMGADLLLGTAYSSRGQS